MSRKNNLQGISCDIFRAKNETEHFHRDVELLFLIEGHIHVAVEDNEFLVETENILLVNSNKVHYIYVDEDALVCRLNISYEMLADVFEEEYIAFWCNLLREQDPGYREMRSIIRDIIMLKLQNDKKDGFRLMEQYGKLLNTLTRNYRISVLEHDQKNALSDSARIQRILGYINNNYREPISLQALADEMHVSVSTLSRLFKKATGMKFPDYINKVRMNYAARELLHSNKPITDIAVDNGFTTPSTFNRVFKEMYGTSPSQYKRTTRNVTIPSKEELTEEEAFHIRQYLDSSGRKDEKVSTHPVIDLHANTGGEFHNITNRTISLGAFYQLTNSSVQQQIRQMVEELHLSHIRMWNVFSPNGMIARSPRETQLSFEQVDLVLDFLVSLKVHPFLDMTDHPECVIRDSRRLYFRKEDSMGFENKEQWGYFLDTFMSHVVFRYGTEEVSQWIFEFGDYKVTEGLEYFETEVAYYEGNVYREVFEQGCRIIKSHCPGAMVGGPDWVFDGKPLDMEGYLRDWEESGIYPDFYSILIFPTVESPEEKKLLSHNDSDRVSDPDFMKNQILEARNRLQMANAPRRPLFVTEMTTILSNRNALNDHCFRATNVLRITNLFQDYADMVCFWVATDRLSLHYASSDILHGGSGLMSKDGIPKPSYYALYFAGKLGSRLLDRGTGYMAVQNSVNNIYILCYNHKNLMLNYEYEDNAAVNVHNVDTMFADNDGMEIRFMLHGLDPGKEYVIKRHMVNQEYGSVMDEWRRLGFEAEMRSNDIAYMKNVCIPRIQMEHKVAEEGQIYLEAVLKPHEMLLLHVYR